MALRCLFVLTGVVLNSQRLAATQLKPLRKDNGDDGVVCISIAAFEATDYVEALIKNVLHFAEPTTKVAMHLNTHSNYSHEWLHSLETDRVTVTKRRIAVKPFKGSILYAHMLNAETMDKRWHKTCDYFVLQASNMMWVRSGYEAEVRQRRWGQIVKHERRGCQHGHDITEEILEGGKGLYAWGQPEGSFYPMDTVRGFRDMMADYLKRNNDHDGSLVIHALCYLEAFTLQTYALNFDDIPDVDSHAEARPLSWNHIHGPKSKDFVPMDEIKKISRGASGWEGYYAVKRVQRDLTHPVTRFITEHLCE
mmetsp:Transcript_69577/g.193602  ORF Transcript_69577/g.193602 Transcript_69577/m.193602 type:complete len:308 (+) Transcript_69577:87-1010(+)